MDHRSIRSRPLASLALGVASALAAASTLGAGIEPLGVDISIQGKPFEGEGCEGGEWSLSWRGELPGETNSIGDLLISYSSFDTTNVSAPSGPPATLTVKPITCRDHQGKVVLQTSMGGGKREVRGVVALKNDPGIPSPFFDFSVDDAGVCRVKTPQMSQELESNVFQVRAPTMATLVPQLLITREDLEKGFTKRYNIEGMAVVSALMCMGTPIERGQVTLRYKSNDQQPTIQMAGCVHVARGASTEVTAKVSPAGGSLRFLSDPGATLGLQPKGNSVTVTGATPGRATLKGEYTYNGKTASATLPASSVELLSINGAQPIPKLGLLGPNGKPNSKVYKFPLQTNPAGAGDLLSFTVEPAGIASAITQRDSIGIQPVREGRARIQAKTVCGAPIGQPFEIEVATCDDEVRADLQRQQEELIRREKDIVRRITQMLADPEFQRASTEIKDTTINLATKTAELIAATLTAGEAGAVKNGAGSALNLKQIETAQTLWDGYNVFNDSTSGNYTSAAVGLLFIAINDARASALKSAYEATGAAEKFGRDLGIIAGVAQELETLEPQHDAIIRQVFDVTRRLNQCDKLPPPPPLPPPPKKPDPKQPPKTQPPPAPPPVEVPPSEPPAQDPSQPTPPESPPIVDPPRGPVSGGLCVRRVDEPVSAAELRNLTTATNEFRTVAQRARDVFEKFQATLEEMKAANAMQGAARTTALATFAPRYDAFVQQYFQLGEAARQQPPRFALCTEELPAQVDRIRSSGRAE